MSYKVFELVVDEDADKIWFELIPVKDFELSKVDIKAIEMGLEIEDYTFLPAPNGGTYLVTKKDHIDPESIDPSGCTVRHKKGGFMVVD